MNFTEIADHMCVVMNLLNTLVEKSISEELGPADGALYMQLCNTAEAWAKILERNFYASLPNLPGKCDIDPDSGSQGNIESKGDRPSDSIE